MQMNSGCPSVRRELVKSSREKTPKVHKIHAKPRAGGAAGEKLWWGGRFGSHNVGLCELERSGRRGFGLILGE